jgi:hypothetical protein
MIVSHKYNFVFVAAPRTGTTSAEWTIAPHLGEEDFCNRKPGVPLHKHDSYKRAVEVYPQAEPYWSFGFVRNPWDQVASFYNWWHTNLFPHCAPVPFAEWIEMGDNLAICKTAALLQGVDTVFRYEDFNPAWEKIFKKTGIPIEAKLPRTNTLRSKRGYKYLYDRDTWDRVAGAYAEEIKLGGYGNIRL